MKKIIYNSYNPLTAFFSLRTLITLSGQRLVLLAYHTVCDEIPVHIKHLYQPRTAKAFEEDMEYLLRYYEPVDLNGILQMLQNGLPSRKNYFFVTFDDGLSGFYHHAVPILLKKGIPATCFLNSDFIDNKDLFYRFKISIIIEEIQKHKDNPGFWKNFHELKEKYSIPAGYYRKVLLNLNQSHSGFISTVADMLNIDFNDYLKKNQPYLTGQQIDELIDKGFHFGGHSIDHPDFCRLSENEIVRQAVQSTREISEKFNLKYHAFAFPYTDFGITKSTFNKIYAEGNIDVTFGSAGIKHDDVKRNLQRIPVEEFNLTIDKRLKADYFYYLIKGLFFRNTIRRK
jgi:peptidoglycan/xylan/chitin deacetylase (PgdA/CDA1 family)